MSRYRQLCELICTAEREAGRIMLGAHDIIAENKTDRRNVVTEYDRRVQEYLIKTLGSAVDGARFFCEENDRQDDLYSEDLFVIDPIDGTANFVHGLHHSCISVAYASRGRVLAAAVYNPYADEMFSAVKGEGAWLNGREIHVDDCGLENGLVCVGTAPYCAQLLDPSFDLIKKACRDGLDIRRQGAAALDLCSVAAGRACAYFEYSVCLWDRAAGELIVSEAGGISLCLDGSDSPWRGGTGTIIAGGRRAVEQLLALRD